MPGDLAPIENIKQLLKINLRRKKIESYQALISVIKQECESLSLELIIKLVRNMNNQNSEVIESHRDFILR